ncbi:triose-phosphate isomerase [bacterium]|nr:triose-phosphate isomerase [bacterium]
MRTPIIAGNWKLNYKQEQAGDLARQIVEATREVSDVEVVLCPVYTSLETVRRIVEHSPVKLGAQDMFWEESGAFTGEVSASLLKDAGCSLVIIGHSERRQYFNETNETVNRKVKAALTAGLIPIMCVGETLPEREAGKVESVISDHLLNGLAGLSSEEISKIIIAYEPVWAIGTGKNATPDQAQEVHLLIRKLLAKVSDSKTAEKVRIQYGGSVKPDNIKALMAQPDIDGALVGGAGLKAETFVPLVKFKS